MKKFTLSMIFVFAGMLVFAAGLKAQSFKEGKWTMTMVTTMEGAMGEEYKQAMAELENMPPEQKAMMQQMMGATNVQMNVGSEGITTTITQCLSGENPVPDMNEEGNADCRVTHTTSGNTVNFKVTCKGNESTGKMTYDGDRMNGVIKSHQITDGQKTDVTIKVSGQYLGPCSDD